MSGVIESAAQEQKVEPPVDGQSKSSFTASHADTPVAADLITRDAQKLVAERDHYHRERNIWVRANKELQEQLAAVEAREYVLRDNLDLLFIEVGEGRYEADDRINRMRALPFDDSALRAWGANLLRDIGDRWAGLYAENIKDALRRRADDLERMNVT